jgi:glutaredoxin 3
MKGPFLSSTVPCLSPAEFFMADVIVYTRQFCGYCASAKALFDKKGVSYVEHDATGKPELREEMISKSGRNTFPQIFIDGQHVGGCDDLHALDRAGKLDPLLSQ